MARRRIKKELEDFETKPSSRIWLGPVGDDLFKWKAMITGSVNTPYSGGFWRLSIILPQDYPFKPPKMRWITRIFHSNLSGEHPQNCPCCTACLSELNDKWSPAFTVAKILCLLRDILDHPEPDCHLSICQEACKLFKNNRNAYDKKAREWTLKYGREWSLVNAKFRSDVQKELITDGYLRDILRLCSIDVPNGIGIVITEYLRFT